MKTVVAGPIKRNIIGSRVSVPTRTDVGRSVDASRTVLRSLVIALSIVVPVKAFGQNPGVDPAVWDAYQDAMEVAAGVREAFPDYPGEVPCGNVTSSSSRAALENCMYALEDYIENLDSVASEVENWRSSSFEPFNAKDIEGFRILIENTRETARQRMDDVDYEYRRLPSDEVYLEEKELYEDSRTKYRLGLELYKSLLEEYRDLVELYLNFDDDRILAGAKLNDILLDLDL